MVQGDTDVTVDVTVTNTAGHAVSVAKWQLPSDRLQGPLLRIIKDDGTAVPYTGPLIKRAAATAADLVRFEAGESRHYSVELTGAYALGNGRFTIEYAGRGKDEADATVESAIPLTLWAAGRTEPATGMSPVER